MTSSPLDFKTFVSSIPRGLRAWDSWTKSSHASVLPRPNSYDSSVSMHAANTFELMNIVSLELSYTEEFMYRLDDIMHPISDSHECTCQRLSQWITTKANLGESNRKLRIGKAMPPPVSDDPLWTSSRKHPDVCWYEDEEVLLQFEVVSNCNYDKTLNKLCLGLIDQHRSWKNRKSDVESIVGFLFPVQNTAKSVEACGRCVHKVRVTWCDEPFEYQIKITPVRRNEVWTTISQAKHTQLQVLGSLLNNPNNHFTLPLTEQYIQNTFSLSAQQVKSGESVVILDNIHAYKRSFRVRALQRLVTLALSPVPWQSYKACALPSVSSTIVNFFVFDRYSRALTVEEIARLDFKNRFITAVLESLKVMHEEARIAHLDIRIENICWDDQQRVVFIDLDRSAAVETPAKSCVGRKYGNSKMYLFKDDWTAQNVDYRQVAVMIGLIEGNRSPHTISPKLTHQFIATLYNDGKLILVVCNHSFIGTPYVQVNTMKSYIDNGI